MSNGRSLIGVDGGINTILLEVAYGNPGGESGMIRISGR